MVPELDDPELDDPDVAELGDEEAAPPEEEDVAELVEPVDKLDWLATVAAALLCESAGSCPETSWTKITVNSARNNATLIAITRRRIARTRLRRAARRSAPTRLASRGGA